MVLEGDGGAFDDLAQERVKEAAPAVRGDPKAATGEALE